MSDNLFSCNNIFPIPVCFTLKVAYGEFLLVTKNLFNIFCKQQYVAVKSVNSCTNQ